MDNIKTLFLKYEELQSKKENLLLSIHSLQLNNEEKRKKLQNLKRNELFRKIQHLEEEKNFLETYPSYLKSGLKGFFKNLFASLKFFLLSFFILVILMSYVTYFMNFSKFLEISIFLSTILTIFCFYIHPVINNHNIKKGILEKYSSIEDMDLQITDLKEKQKEWEKEISDLQSQIEINNTLLNEKKRAYSYVEKLDIELRYRLQEMVDAIFMEIEQPYNYEDIYGFSWDSNLLSLKKQ